MGKRPTWNEGVARTNSLRSLHVVKRIDPQRGPQPRILLGEGRYLLVGNNEAAGGNAMGDKAIRLGSAACDMFWVKGHAR